MPCSQQERVDELEAGEPFGKRVELGAVSDHAERASSGRSGGMPSTRISPREGADQAGHQVHERGFAGAVGAHQAGDAGRNGQVDAIDAQHFAVEARDVVEDDAGARSSRPPPRRGSCAPACRGRSARSTASSQTQLHPQRQRLRRAGRGRRPRHWLRAWAAFEQRHPDRADQVADVEQIAPIGAHACR